MTQETRVQNAFDEVASTFHQSLPRGVHHLRRDIGPNGYCALGFRVIQGMSSVGTVTRHAVQDNTAGATEPLTWAEDASCVKKRGFTMRVMTWRALSMTPYHEDGPAGRQRHAHRPARRAVEEVTARVARSVAAQVEIESKT